MTASIALHPSPSAGFDQPFEILAACHDRVARMLALLQRLQDHLGAGLADEPARQAARDVMRYFDQAAPHHHQDEERHVFPVLLGSSDERLVALANRLTDDHRQMAAAWASLRPSLQALAQGQWTAAQAEAHFAVWQAFIALYAGHARLEDEQAYPAARVRLGPVDQVAMGEEMAKRRGVR